MTDEIFIRNDFPVELVQYMGSDEFVCKAAKVSTIGAASIDSEESAGLIRFLMSNRHGSPFEHGAMTFRISAPIFVWREFMRHRIGFSYNEESGRYKELDGVFYMPSPTRNLVQEGKPGAYNLVPGTQTQYQLVDACLTESYTVSWQSYQDMLDQGIAKEVARICLPVSIYSTAYVTCNPRSVMAFLSLRTDDPESMFPSKPLWEINEVANQMEAIFTDLFPTTSAAFNTNRRVGP